MMDLNVIKMHAQLPTLLAKVSEFDEQLALSVIRDWGAKSRTINSMWEELNDAIQGCNHEAS